MRETNVAWSPQPSVHSVIWFPGGGDPRVAFARVQDCGEQGYSLLQEMSTDFELRNIPVLMISEVEDIKSVVRCIELGATDYLTKPFNPSF
jgi:DNA-binding response OmpR family regulator